MQCNCFEMFVAGIERNASLNSSPARVTSTGGAVIPLLSMSTTSPPSHFREVALPSDLASQFKDLFNYFHITIYQCPQEEFDKNRPWEEVESCGAGDEGSGQNDQIRLLRHDQPCGGLDQSAAHDKGGMEKCIPR